MQFDAFEISCCCAVGDTDTYILDHVADIDLDQIAPKFETMLVISAKDKDSVTRQDIEKQHEMRRACIRTSVALAQLTSLGISILYHINIEITPVFAKYIKELRTSRDTEREYVIFSDELKNAGLGAATLRTLSEMTSLRSSSGRGDPMETD